MTSQEHLIVLADGRRASMFACGRTPLGGVQLERVATLTNQHGAEHEPGRPVPGGGAEWSGPRSRSGLGAAPQAVAVGHSREDERRRFAREVVRWLAEFRDKADVGRVTLFAPPRVLAMLRAEGAERDEWLVLREGDLAHLRLTELATHPALRPLIAGA